MAALEEARKGGGEAGPPPAPPLAWWSAEVDAIADLRDAVLELKDTLVRVNVPKEKQNSIPPINWTRRPGDKRDAAAKKFAQPTEEQYVKHQTLVGKLLPHKAHSDG